MPRRHMTAGDHRMEFADYARDAKREGGMCAFGHCTNPHAPHEVPNYQGQYGGSRVCPKHAEKLGYDPETDTWDRPESSESGSTDAEDS